MWISDKNDEYVQRLLYCMEEKMPFRHKQCNLRAVSQATGIPVKQLTSLLNNRLQKNFHDFINEYRVDEARLLLLSDSYNTLSIESIARECGFGSRSAFLRAFKKFSNNLTPSEFIRQQSISY